VFFGIHDVGSEDESCFTALNDHDNGPGTVGLDDSALLAMGEGPAVVLELNLLGRALGRQTLWPDYVTGRAGCGCRGYGEAEEENDSG